MGERNLHQYPDVDCAECWGFLLQEPHHPEERDGDQSHTEPNFEHALPWPANCPLNGRSLCPHGCDILP